MSPTSDPVETRLEWAIQIALEAGQFTQGYFRSSRFTVDRKSDRSPVTEADRGAEQLLRKRITEKFPEDAILGEEFEEKKGTSGYCWVLDPIDGTKSFIHGIPLYTNLVAVMHENKPLIGVINAPAIGSGELVYAKKGGGTWLKAGDSPPTRTQVSTTKSLSDSLLVTSEVANFRERPRDPDRLRKCCARLKKQPGDEPKALAEYLTAQEEINTTNYHDAMDVYLQLDDKARLSRTWGDAYGYYLVATGQAEVALDPLMNLWDIAALQPIIVEAGGTFVNWDGVATIHSPEALATNGLVTEEVLKITRNR